ncbi:MAG: hypothetical protein HYU86_00655 [Chloroflexi bacterium]|nr:hypothetical protein [Chloroflexota bacterium]
MSKAFNDNIRRALNLAQELQELAEKGDQDRNDDSCGLLYARVRASATEILELAKKEMEGHQSKGKWD